MSLLKRLMTLTIGACCVLLPQGGYGLQFINSMENSSWTPRSSSYSCILDHPIIDFGHARFQHDAGEPVKFYLDSNRSIFRKGTVILASRAPNWRHQDGNIVLGEVKTLPKHRVITVTEALATRMLSALEHGMIPTFDGNPWFSKAESVRVGLSSVGFQEAYSQYQACERDLLLVNFDQVEKTRVLFKTGRAEISAGSVRRLLDVVTYCKTDERVTQIYVDGHTDSVGLKKDNVTISRNRAQAVTDHLVGLGLSPAMIVTRFHGEKYPVARNNTAANRTKNRRATVRLVRE